MGINALVRPDLRTLGNYAMLVLECNIANWPDHKELCDYSLRTSKGGSMLGTHGNSKLKD